MIARPQIPAAVTSATRGTRASAAATSITPAYAATVIPQARAVPAELTVQADVAAPNTPSPRSTTTGGIRTKRVTQRRSQRTAATTAPAVRVANSNRAVAENPPS